jgi:drug/metabolite transporter (DMT)-like permease
MTDLRGLFLALAALICWSISPFFFTNMGKRVGPFSTNLLRLALALALLVALLLIRRAAGIAEPPPGAASWLWLTASGVVGLAIGDAFLYRAFVTVGPERTSQIQTLAPAATAAIAWTLLGEVLSRGQAAGMGLILAGVFLATSSAARKKTALLAAEARAEGAELPAGEKTGTAAGASTTMAIAEAGRTGFLWTGMMAAVWSALFQAVGTVLAREAFLHQQDLDPLSATTIRIGAGAAALWGYARASGPLGGSLGAWTDPKVLRLLAAGTLFGPFCGMLCYVSALKFAPAGIVTTVTFMAPLLIIPAGAVLYGTRVTFATVCGTALSLAGVVLLGLG